MASSSSKPFPFLLLFLFLFLSAAAVANGDDVEKTTTHIRVYFQELFGETSFVVAGLHNNASTFGNVHVFDNALTEGPELSSELVGRAQGMSVDDSLGVFSDLLAENFVFTGGEYNGSSLSVFGTSTAALEVNDHPIVGGTGQFRMARGYALSQALTSNETYLLVQWDFYILPYAS